LPARNFSETEPSRIANGSDCPSERTSPNAIFYAVPWFGIQHLPCCSVKFSLFKYIWVGFAFALDDTILTTLFKYQITSSVSFFSWNDHPFVCYEFPSPFDMRLDAFTVDIFFSLCSAPHTTLYADFFEAFKFLITLLAALYAFSTLPAWMCLTSFLAAVVALV